MANQHDQHGYAQALQAAGYLKIRSAEFPRVGMVLGSGLDTLVARLTDSIEIPYRFIPHFPIPAVEGHTGKLMIGKWKRFPVAVLAGRVHLYEGYTPAQVVFAVRVLGLAGIKTLILTCAAGGIARSAVTGSLMVFSDHLNLQCSSPFAGVHDGRWGEKFVDLSEVYDRRLRQSVLKTAKALGLKCFEGVYAAVLGPNYETPAEIRALRQLGADAVGMSTVPEAIAARQLNMRVIAVALIANRAGGIVKRPLRHDEVLAVGSEAAQDLARLLDHLLPSLAD